MSTATVRVYGDVYTKLRILKREDETFGDAIDRIIPEDGPVIERPQSEVVGVTVDEEVRDRLNNMAGINVSVADVVDLYAERTLKEQ